MHLGVAQLVADVVEPFGRRQLTGALEHALGHVDADDSARRRGARRLASRQPGAAADVEYLVTGADPVGGAKVLVVSAQLGVVEVQAGRRGHRRNATTLCRSLLRLEACGLEPLERRRVRRFERGERAVALEVRGGDGEARVKLDARRAEGFRDGLHRGDNCPRR